MENLKELNEILQEKNNLLKQEIENIKFKTNIEDNSKNIKKYENRIMELEKELLYYKQREEEVKQNTKKYFQEKTKFKTRYCECCDETFKESSWSNHKISKKHISNAKQNN